MMPIRHFLILSIATCLLSIGLPQLAAAPAPSPSVAPASAMLRFETASIEAPIDDDAGPLLIYALMMMAVMAVMLVVCMLLLGIGIGIGLMAVAGGALLVLTGVISSSLIFGFTRRSPSAGIRLFLMQVMGVAGMAAGIGASWIASWLTGNDWSMIVRFGVGGGVGLLCGLLIAWLFTHAWRLLSAWVYTRFGGSRLPKPN